MRNVPNRQRVFSRDGLAGDLYGTSDSRPPLVLLHGLSFDRRMWDPVLVELAHVDPGRRVLTVDLPGHGESADPATWELREGTDSLHETIVEHCLERPVVVGHSAGAILATAYAAQFDTSGVINVDASLDVRGFAAVLHSMEGALRGPEFESAWRALEAGFGTELLPARMQALVRSYEPPRQEVALGFFNELLVKSVSESEADRLALLSAVSAKGLPYQVIHGRSLPTEYEHWLDATLPGVLCEVFEGSGHFPMLADPLRFARVLARSGSWSNESAQAS